MDKKISQLQEVLASDGTTYLTVVQGAPLLNAIIKPDKLIDSAGGMLTKDYVGDEATKSVHNSDELGNILAEEYVTYVNNYKNVDLSNNTLLTKGLKLNTSSPYVVQNPGEIGWNASEGTVDLRLFNNTTLQVGQEIYFYGKAIETIANGNPVMIAGVQGNHLTFKNAVFSELSVYPQKFLGVATQNIAKNDFGYVTWFGKVNDVYTTGWAEADNLYISPTNSLLTNVQPQAPNLIIRVGSVIKLSTGSAENGIIGVRPTFGIRMQDLNDVNGTPLTTTGQIPVWDNARKVHDFTKNINDYQRTEQKNIANGYAGLDANKKLSTEFETDPIFVTSPAHTITDNNITNWNNKENTANKQNSLATDGTGVKFPTVDAVNAGLGGKQATLVSGTNIKTVNGTSLLGSGDVSNLLASYTHSGNKEVYVSSIDYATNTFTSVGHGLINSADLYKTLMLAINRNEAIYPYNVMPFNPTDLTTIGLFVVNATPDTFQLSKTAGGAVITLINKAENDLTKWHFEYTTVKTITISGLLGKINAGVKTVIDGTIIWGYAQYIGGASAGMAYIKSSDGATPSFNYSVIYGGSDYPVPCFGGQIIHTDIYTNNGHRKIFDIAVYGYGTALNNVAMTNKYINFVTPIVIADSNKSFVTLEGVSIANGTTIKIYSL